MDDLLVCRVCLLMDVKMYNLRSSPLDDYFESICGVNPHKHKLLTQVCAECAILINKCYMFKEKCVRGISVLQNMLCDNVQIKTKDLLSIDRKHLRLCSRISPSLPENIHYFHHTSYPKNKCQQSKATAIIKDEHVDNYCNDSGDNYDDVYNETKITITQPIAINESQEINKTNIQKVDVELKQKPCNKVELIKTQNYKDSLGPKTLKTRKANKVEIIKSLDEQISQHYDVIARTLEEQIAEIKAREHSASYQKSTLKCTICFKVFVLKQAYEFHMKKHDPSWGSLECKVCGTRFRSTGALHSHQLLHRFRFVCRSCQQTLTSRDKAKIHILWHTGVTFKCQQCFEEFRHKTSYLSHLRKKHPSQHICNLCGKPFFSKLGLKQHKTVMHWEHKDVEVSGPRCDKCAIQFIDQKAFDLHLGNSSNHVGDTDLLQFDSPENWLCIGNCLATAINPTLDSDLWYVQCSEMIPSARENWFHHRRDHRDQQYRLTRQLLYICELCGHKSANSGILKYHILEKHSTERPHGCPHCPRRFSTLGQYKCHLRSHSDLRPYVCRHCPMAFKYKSNVQKHEKTAHSGLRPYSCGYCNKSYRCTTGLNCHVRYVHHKVPLPKRRRKSGAKRNNM